MLHTLLAQVVSRTDEKNYLLAATWKCDSELMMQKWRIIMILPETLAWVARNRDRLKSEGPEQRSQITTLLQMYGEYARGDWPRHKIVSLPRE